MPLPSWLQRPVYVARTYPRAMVHEAFCTVRNGLSPLGRVRPLPKPRPLEGRVPVVMVHGFLGHAENWRPLRRRLIKAGWSDLHAVNYPSTRSSLEQICEHIHHAVEAVDGPVDLVGHSLGAVACRAWLKYFQGAGHVRRFVSLGGPHAGTSLWWATPSHLRAVLRPNGMWVRALSEGPEPVPTTVIRAEYDQQVFPPERAALPGAREIVLSGHGHNGLLWSPDAHDAVIDALSS